MIYATNSSFRLVEHLEFVKMISDLRPGYNPPNRIDIGAKLLDLVYKNSITRCSGMLHEQTVTMSIDGWSHWRSHRMGCTGPDPTNFWDFNMGPAQNFVTVLIHYTIDPTIFSTPVEIGSTPPTPWVE